MSDLFITMAAIVPKVSQAASHQPLTTTAGDQGISGVTSTNQISTVATPGGQPK